MEWVRLTHSKIGLGKFQSWRSVLSDLEVELQGENGLGYPVGCRPHMQFKSCVSCGVQRQDKKTWIFCQLFTSYGQHFL